MLEAFNDQKLLEAFNDQKLLEALKDPKPEIIEMFFNVFSDNVRYLISKGVDLNYQNAEGKTISHYHMEVWPYPGLDVLIQFAPDVSIKSNSGVIVFHELCKTQDFEPIAVKAYVKHSNAKLNQTDGEGMTPLLAAIAGGRTITVESLIKNRANVNGLGKFFHNPLLWATLLGKHEIVKVLIKNKASFKKAVYGDQNILDTLEIFKPHNRLKGMVEIVQSKGWQTNEANEADIKKSMELIFDHARDRKT